MNVRDEYSIDFRNGSQKKVAFCIAPAAPHAHAMAWKSGEAAPGERVQCSWALDYAFFYSLTGTLRAGSVIVPRLTEPVTSGSRTIFSFDGSSFSLRGAGRGEPGVLTIEQAASIPPDTAGIGLAIDGAPAVVVQAQPSIQTQFVMHPVYWLALSRSRLEPGVIAHASAFFAVARIEFRGDGRHISTALTADGKLVVKG